MNTLWKNKEEQIKYIEESIKKHKHLKGETNNKKRKRMIQDKIEMLEKMIEDLKK